MNISISAMIGGKRSRSVETLSEDRSSHSDSTEEVLEIKGDQFEGNKDERALLNLNSYDMWALGLTTSIGGHYFAWNAGLTVGFGSFIIVLFLISTAYYALVLCMAELSSALPFAGGAYGIARVTLGIYPGFLVAVCDSFKSIIYVSVAVFSIGQILTIVIGESSELEYFYWFGFFGVYLAVLTYGGRFFWRVNFMLATLSVLILLMYIFGSIPFVNFMQNASYPNESGPARWFHGGAYEVIAVFPLATRFFQGLQSINLASGQIKNPKKEVPRGYIGAMSTVMVTSFLVLFLATSVRPGLETFVIRLRPLSNGFKQMFALPPKSAALLSLPATFMSGFGFMYYYGVQISAMGKSGLLNPKFGYELPSRSTPVVALVIGSVIGYVLCVIQFVYPDTQDQIYALSILGATATFLSIFISFIMFRNYFPTIKREFVSPLGMAGAVYGFTVFLLCFISVCGFQKDQVAVIVFSVILGVSSIYYYFVVRKRQVFSEEEKTVMFKAYLMKNNAAKAVRIKRGPGVGSTVAGSVAGSNASKATNKKSSIHMSRIEVAPPPQGSDPSSGRRLTKESENRTPTSTTMLQPYRPAEPTHPHDAASTPTGSHRTTDLHGGEAAAAMAGIAGMATLSADEDIETGGGYCSDHGGHHNATPAPAAAASVTAAAADLQGVPEADEDNNGSDSVNGSVVSQISQNLDNVYLNAEQASDSFSYDNPQRSSGRML